MELFGFIGVALFNYKSLLSFNYVLHYSCRPYGTFQNTCLIFLPICRSYGATCKHCIHLRYNLLHSSSAAAEAEGVSSPPKACSLHSPRQAIVHSLSALVLVSTDQLLHILFFPCARCTQYAPSRLSTVSPKDRNTG